ncbi:hypothetical protein GCK72_022443 [Caenorhabditis remanei]|uniref:Uncharacterized protein n=1 Tax=Caenorhabditis remanei TaxID=31234 RepID=A0A6A5FTU2_CAERE|nr:hypothetical protein GCK72_022443 [Caenorhabditis remanei]KAF1745992.1 hypothetical protein GCK72_022443 [Caenorhabditis remanei]
MTPDKNYTPVYIFDIRKLSTPEFRVPARSSRLTAMNFSSQGILHIGYLDGGIAIAKPDKCVKQWKINNWNHTEIKLIVSTKDNKPIVHQESSITLFKGVTSLDSEFVPKRSATLFYDSKRYWYGCLFEGKLDESPFIAIRGPRDRNSSKIQFVRHSKNFKDEAAIYENGLATSVIFETWKNKVKNKNGCSVYKYISYYYIIILIYFITCIEQK